jgi:hypothetical protein
MEKWFRGQQKGAAYKEEHLDGFEGVSVQHFVRSCKLHLRVKGLLSTVFGMGRFMKGFCR